MVYPDRTVRTAIIVTFVTINTLASIAAQNATPSQPGRIGIVMGEFTPLPRYDAALHQAKLIRPRRWCGQARKPEPLLREAIEMASGQDTAGLGGMRLIHQIPIIPADNVGLTRDEAVCEIAAKAYDRIAYSGNTLLSEHTRIAPVLVIRLGHRWIVEEARSRGPVWEVMFFDASWTHLGFGYGAGQ